jgi:tetratricopeptide (TPR) repeat protein
MGFTRGRNGRSGRLLATALVLGFAAVAPAAVRAQDAGGREAAYDALLQDPGNVDKAFAYVDTLVQDRDYEAAVAVLERLAIRYPDEAKIRLEIGVLYYRLGSYLMAERAFDQVKAMANADPALKQRAEEFSRKAKPQTVQSQFSGKLYAGLRYQTNANAGPDSRNIQDFDATIDRPKDADPDDDLGGFGGFMLNHVYDFDAQNGAALETEASGFALYHTDVTDLDELHFGLQSGIGVNPFAALGDRLRIQPRGNLEFTVQDGEWLEFGGGPGLGVSYKASETVRITADYDVMFRDFDHVADLGDTQHYSGSEQQGGLAIAWQVLPKTTLSFGVGGRFADTRKDFLDFNAVNASIGLLQAYGSPIEAMPLDWWFSLGARYEGRWFEGVDPEIDDDVKRQDDVYRVSATNLIPLNDAWSVTQQVEYLIVDSNLSNFSYDNFAATLSANWRF